MNSIRISGAVLASVLVAACAIDNPDAKSSVTGSLKPRPAAESAARPASKSSDDTKRAFCAQRHIDYQAGKDPGGAKTIEQKQADDRLCEALGRQS